MTELCALSDAEWLHDPALKTVLAALRSNGGEARIAGGAVRDGLLGRPVSDIDIATDQAPEQVIALAKASGLSVHPTGLEHGTVTVVAGSNAACRSFEVTTLRVDVETDGRRAKVEFTDDWAVDAHRRDFTINALYCNENGEVYDLVNGLDDLRQRKIKFVGTPSKRIEEDHLRILRFFRFYAWFGEGEPDADALAACVKAKASLAKLSRERIRREFFKLAIAPEAVFTLALMVETGILQTLLPGRFELEKLDRLCQIEQECQLAPDPVRRLRALSKDQSASGLQEAFVLSNAETKRLEALQQLPPLSPVFRHAERQTLLYWRGQQAVIDKVLLDWSAAAAEADDREYAALLSEAQGWQRPQMPVGGKDLQAAGIAEGKELGRLLQALEDWWVAGGFKAEKSDLMARLAAIR
ncbi:MAG: CCA tRNA nucleotidyltransferase [Alphaproteobacteria bacterium]|nr:CCA tRNA nucleotidyltransferase [Alphaproteobacteria bacterium]